MPFATRVVPQRTDIQEVVFHNAVKNVLEKSAVSNMIGLLQQLNVLSQHASDVFGGLLEDASRSSKRISSVKERIASIESKVPNIENIYLENPPSFFYDNPYTGQQWARKDQLRGFLFRRDRASSMINKRREVADVVPDLSPLDPFTTDKQPCIKKYSDTNFFMNEWIQEQQAKMEEEKRKRKLRKEARKKRKKLKRKNTKKIMKVQKKRYNALGAEFASNTNTNESEFVEARKFDIDGKDLMESIKYDTSSPNSTRTSKILSPQTPQIPQKSPKSPNTNISPKMIQTNGRPPINPMMQTNGSTNPPPNPIMQMKQQIPPPNPMMQMLSNGNNVPPPNPVEVQSNSHQSQPSYVQSSNGPPPFQPTHVPTETVTDFNGPMTAQMRILQSRQLAEKRYAQEELLRKRKEEEYERQKSKAALLLPQKSFLSQISKGGAKLKKVDTDKIKREKPKDQRSMLMSSIQKGRNLKKVEINEQKAEKKEPENASIFAILQRRQLIADSSSEDSDSDWGSDEE